MDKKPTLTVRNVRVLIKSTAKKSISCWEESKALRAFIVSKGGELHLERRRIGRRNERIYARFQHGTPVEENAKRYKLSKTMVGMIVKAKRRLSNEREDRTCDINL